MVNPPLARTLKFVMEETWLIIGNEIRSGSRLWFDYKWPSFGSSNASPLRGRVLITMIVDFTVAFSRSAGWDSQLHYRESGFKEVLPGPSRFCPIGCPKLYYYFERIVVFNGFGYWEKKLLEFTWLLHRLSRAPSSMCLYQLHELWPWLHIVWLHPLTGDRVY